MRRHLDYRGLAEADRSAAVAIGNFDGVHLGHQSVLALARAAAVRCGAPFGVVTFEPHPRSFFAPDAKQFRLMTAGTRASRFAKLGVEQLYELSFDAELAALPADRFISEVLIGGLGLRHIVAGADFRFGKGRGGDVGLLAELGGAAGLGVTVAPTVADESVDYSSTAIREALERGDPEAAAKILGHLHRIEGPVQHGDKRGRGLGYPTINLWLEGLHIPRYGVYSVLVDVLEGPHQGTFGGVASIGERPTFGNNHPNLEAFLFDFAGDLYGARVSVALIAFQRPELRFESPEALVRQMQTDVTEARARIARYIP